MKQVTFLTIFILVFCFATFAQTDKNVCPQIKFVSPNNLIGLDKPTNFIVKVTSNEGKNNLLYEWTFSRGKILKGQGTTQIEFIPNEEDEGANVTASVMISGLPEGCSDTYSDTFAIETLAIIEPYDDFGKIALNDYRSRLDNLISKLANNPNSEGLITLEFAKNSRDKYKISLLRNINKQFIFRKFDLTRISFAIAKKNIHEQSVFWITSADEKRPKYVYVKEDYQIVKAEELERKLKELFPKN